MRLVFRGLLPGLVVAVFTLGPVEAWAQYHGLTNVAQGRPVAAATGNAIGLPQYVTDGKADTYWFSYSVQEYTVDLGLEVAVGKIVVFTYQASGVTISSSTDGVTFTPRHGINATDAQHGNWIGSMVYGPVVFEANGTYGARYLKYRSVNLGCGCYQGSAEFAVYEWIATPPPTLSGDNLAVHPGTTVANAWPYVSATDYPPSNVADGDLLTVWKGAHSGWYTGMAGQRLGYAMGRARIDLGAELIVHGARVRRPAGGGAQNVSVSFYNAADQEIAWQGQGDPAVVGSPNPALGDVDLVLDVPVQARYVRVLQMNPLVRDLSFQPALAEVEVYGAAVGGDTTPPALTGVPASITADADRPGGAVVSWTAPSAVDDVDGAVPVSCMPASGSMFAIGATTVTCAAADSAGNSASASFVVTVVGPAEQLARLRALLAGFGLSKGLANSLAAKLRAAEAALARGDIAAACGPLGAFINEAGAQSGKGLTAAQASQLQEAAARIRQALGC